MRPIKAVILMLLFASVLTLSCTTQRVAIVTDENQYGIAYDSRYQLPVSYRPSYVSLKGIYDQFCEVSQYNLNNLFTTTPANAFRCVHSLGDYGITHFMTTDK